MKIPLLDLKTQYAFLQTEINEAINRVLVSGEFIMGPDVQLFEQEVATYLGVKYAISVNSGTDALVIGLRALGIGPGDEVITTPFSFCATAESISNVGAKPIFADIKADTFNIAAQEITAKITSKTKAIMPVHLYGRPADMAKILEIANKYNLKVIEDCAQAFGAQYYNPALNIANSDSLSSIYGKFAGTIGTIGAYSFFPSKNLGAYGDGGLVVTNDYAIAEQAKMLRVHGTHNKHQNEVLGYNSRLDTIQAAILRTKLKYVDRWNQARQRIAQTYNHELEGVFGVITPKIIKGHVFNQYTVRILDGQRDALKEALSQKGIDSMIYYPIPQDQLPVYQGQYRKCDVSHQCSKEVLSLPIWPELKPKMTKQISTEIKLFKQTSICCT